jgi:hypothetical protein
MRKATTWRCLGSGGPALRGTVWHTAAPATGALELGTCPGCGRRLALVGGSVPSHLYDGPRVS